MTPELKAAVERAKHAVAIDGIIGRMTMVKTADLRLILDALAEREWQPIETAPRGRHMAYTEHDLQAFRDRIYVTTGARLTLTDAAMELDRIRGVYSPPGLEQFDECMACEYLDNPPPAVPFTRMADDYFQPVDP